MHSDFESPTLWMILKLVKGTHLEEHNQATNEVHLTLYFINVALLIIVEVHGTSVVWNLSFCVLEMGQGHALLNFTETSMG